MASRIFASASAFWWGEPRLVNGKWARLRARRMRVETTTSDSGPVPRSHSPVDGIRLSRFIRGFLLADQVAEHHGPFVVFRFDRAAQLLAQLQDFGRPRGRGAAPVGVPA